MNLIRFTDPFAGMSSIHKQMDDMFSDLLGATPSARGSLMPAMDVYTKGDKELVAEVHAPGFDKDDIELNVHEGVLEIKGHKAEKDEQKSKDGERSYMLRESSSTFYRRIALPAHADVESITADFKNGVLQVSVPFKELPKPKKIEISSGK